MRAGVLVLAAFFALRGAPAAAHTFRAGAHVVDITPKTFPIRVSGNFSPAYPTSARGKLCVRAIALDDGSTRVAIAPAPPASRRSAC
jgi:hypothetical protein